MNPGTANPPDDASDRDVPLVFDLDRTLVIDDTFELVIMRMLRRQRRNFLRLILALPRLGWAAFKTALFTRANLQADELLFDPVVSDRLKQAQASGRAVWIATASPEEIAHKAADALGVPRAQALGTTKENLKGARKAAALVERFGRGGFDYVGDSKSDVAIWKEARHGIAVARTASARSGFARAPNVREVIDRTDHRAGFSGWRKLIRPHQWPKNALIFLPLFTGHQWGNVDKWILGAWAFVALSFAASSVYVVNDALDWSTDRRHPRKSKRPIAAGKIRPLHAFAVSGLLVALACGVAATSSLKLLACIAGYLLLATSYSFYLKQRMLVDTVVLSHFYIARIITGGVAMSIELSPWLLSFTGFAFFSLAMVKRYCELKQAEKAGRTHNELRGYFPEDPPIIAGLGVGTGLLACLVLSLYLSSTTVIELYRTPQVLWAACPIFFYWIGRVWLLANRGVDVEDPVEFALRDRASYVILVLLAVVVWLAV